MGEFSGAQKSSRSRSGESNGANGAEHLQSAGELSEAALE